MPPYAPEGIQRREWKNEFSPQTHVSPLGLSIAAPSLKNFSIPEASCYFKLAIDKDLLDFKGKRKIIT